MKINSTNLNGLYKLYKSQSYESTKIENSKSYKDKIILSDTGKYISKINEKSEDIDIDKINEIKEKIKSGTYSPNSGDIAKKIIDKIKEHN